MTVTRHAPRTRRLYFEYGAEIEAELARLAAAIQSHAALADRFDPRWLAIQLLEGDEALGEAVTHTPDAAPILAALAESRARLARSHGEEVDVALVNRRYEFVHQVVQGAVMHDGRRRISRSDQIDRIVTHPVWGIPLFLGLMWVVF